MVRLADYAIKFLTSKKVNHAYLVTGGGSIFLSDAVLLNPEMQGYCVHNEQAAAIAAEAHARVSGGPGFSLVTIGPGATNAITGVVGSWMDSVPHIVFSGQSFYNQTIRDTGLRQLGVQEVNVIDMVKPCTKYAVTIREPNSIRFHLEKAYHLATTGRPGPVWLEFPADVQKAMIDPEGLEPFVVSTKQGDSSEPLSQQVQELVEHLKLAKRPIIHVGQGVKIACSEKLFMDIIEKHSICFLTARNANDIVGSDHPLFAGRPGTFPQRGANFTVQNSDFYLAVGTRLTLCQTGYNTKDYARNAYKVLVDIDKAEVNKTGLEIDLRINADAGEFLKELERQLSDVTLDFSEWNKQVKNWQESYPVCLPEYKDQERHVNSYYFTDVLSDLLDEDDAIVTDMGIAFQGTHQCFKVKSGQKLFTNCGLASMGWGLPAAVGASIGGGGRRTICIAGDGGLQMNLQELATMMHYKLSIKLFVLNNGGYLTIKQTQELGFEGRLIGVDSSSGLSFPDLEHIAKAYNFPFIRIENHADLQKGLAKVLSDPQPYICEIMMDPDQDQGPKAVNRRKPDGSFEQTPLEDLYPFLSQDEIKSNMLDTKE